MADLRSIAVAQTRPIRGDVSANTEEHVRLARIAAAEGAQVVAFPELSLTGYELALARELTFSGDDPRLAPLVEAAATSSVVLVVGAPVRIAERLHIGAFILRPDRTIELYTKHRLGAFPPSAACDGVAPPAESTIFHPGDRNPLVRFGEHTAALAICADIGQPAHPQHAADRGAGVYLATMFVIPSDFDGDSARLRGYATRHRMVVGLANFGSPSGGLAAAGRSSIWSETGELIVRLDARGAGVAIATEAREGWRAKAIMMIDSETAGPE